MKMKKSRRTAFNENNWNYQRLEPRNLLSGSGGDVTVTATHIITPHDMIPRLGGQPTVSAINDGDWSSPTTWDTGFVPGTDDIVNIPDGLTVVYDVNSQVRLDVIEVSGQLEFDTESVTSLWLNELFVLPSGSLTIGTADNRVSEFVTTEIVFTDTPDDNGNHFKTGMLDLPGLDPEQYGNGIIVLGSIEIYGQEKTAFVRSTQDIEAGSSQIDVEYVPFDWQPGDQIVLPETSQTPFIQNFGELNETEVFQIAATNTQTLSLSGNTTYRHYGISDNPFGIERYAHVGNLTRNVVFRSENPTGVRGHFMATAMADVDIHSAAFLALGRTSADMQIDNAVLQDGNLIYLGDNQVGRYSLHLHHLHSESIQVVNSVVADGLKWGITVHNTNNALIENNIVYDIDGAGIATESGNEIGNVFRDNLVIKVDGGYQRDDVRAGARQSLDSFGNNFVDIGSDGSGFWLRATAGTFENNFVYDSVGYGFNFNGYYRSIPGSQTQQIDYFAGNETAASKGGLWFTWSQGMTSIANHYQRQTFQDFVGWHLDTDGIHSFHDGELTFENITVIGDATISSLNEGSAFIPTARTNKGVLLGNPSYENFNIQMVDINVSGMNFGIVAPTNAGSQGGSLDGAVLANYVNIAYINGAIHDDNMVYSDVAFLPSLVIRTGSSLPDVVANVWQEGLGVIQEGTLDPDAGAGLPPTFPASITLRPDGELRIDGDNGEDTVHVSLNGDQIVLVANNSAFEFERDLVTSIRFRGFDGNDIFINETDIPSLVFGGAGDDMLYGGMDVDVIFGEAGNDSIRCRRCKRPCLRRKWR